MGEGKELLLSPFFFYKQDCNGSNSNETFWAFSCSRVSRPGGEKIMGNDHHGRRLISMFIAICMLFQVCPAGRAEDYSAMKLRELFSSQREKVTWNDDSEQISYAEYLAQNEMIPDYAGEPVECEIIREESAAAVRACVPETAMYVMRYGYRCTASESNLYASFALDGAVPFREADTMTFDWIWREESKPIRNILGDDVRARQIRESEENARYFANADGLISGELRFCLEAGAHEIELTFASTPVQLLFFTLEAPQQAIPYAEMLEILQKDGWQEASVRLEMEAEDEVAEKNAAVIQRMISDDPLSTPYEAGYKRLNTIGGPCPGARSSAAG